MRTTVIGVVGLLFLASYSCKDIKKENKVATDEMEEAVESVSNNVHGSDTDQEIQFEMEPKSGSHVKGEVTFKEADGTVHMTAELTGLEPGEHAIHIHEKADCSSEDGKSAGGHWNPTHEPHGKWGSPEGYHKGDIGNITANEEGKATLDFATNEWCIGCGNPNKDILNKAVIVHQGADDFTSQPSGDAGSRVSCTGIIQ